MKKIRSKTAGLLLLILTSLLITVPAACASENPPTDNFDNGTSLNVDVRVRTDENLRASIWLDAEGEISLNVDGVNVKKRFDSIHAALEEIGKKGWLNKWQIESLSETMSKLINNYSEFQESVGEFQENVGITLEAHENKINMLMSRTDFNRYQHLLLENFAENNRKMILANENRVNIVLQNTKYNKNQHEALENDYERFLSENFASLKEEYRGFKENMRGRVEALENQRNWMASGLIALVAILGLVGLWRGRGTVRSKMWGGDGANGTGEMKSKAGEKINNLFKRIEPIKESGSLSPAEEKELRSSLDRTIEAYESGDYEKSLKLGKKTEQHIGYEDFELEKHAN